MVQSTHSGALSSINKRSAPSSFSSSNASMPLRRGCIAALNRSAGYTAVTASWPGNSKSVMAGDVRFMATTADVTSVCAASCSSGACALVVTLTSGAAFRSITSAAASLNASDLIAQRHTVLHALWQGNESRVVRPVALPRVLRTAGHTAKCLLGWARKCACFTYAKPLAYSASVLAALVCSAASVMIPASSSTSCTVLQEGERYVEGRPKAYARSELWRAGVHCPHTQTLRRS